MQTRLSYFVGSSVINRFQARIPIRLSVTKITLAELLFCMAPSHTTEELLAQVLEEQKTQTALLQRIASSQEENGLRLLAIVVGSGKQVDELQRQVNLLEELVLALTRQDRRQIVITDIDTVD